MKKFILALLLMLLIPVQAQAAFGLDDTAFAVEASDGVVDCSIDIPGNLLVVLLSYIDGGFTVDNVTLGPGGVGQTLTQLAREREANNTGVVVESYYRKAPNTGSGQTVRATLSGTTSVAMSCFSFTDADQTTTFRTVATSDSEGGAGGTHTATVTTVSGDIVVGHIIAQTAIDPDAGQTEIGNDVTTGSAHAAAHRTASTTSTALEWTKSGGGSHHWAMMAVGVIPDGGGGGGGTTCYRALLGVGC